MWTDLFMYMQMYLTGSHTVLYLSTQNAVSCHTQIFVLLHTGHISTHTGLCLSNHCFVSYHNEFRQNLTEQFFYSKVHGLRSLSDIQLIAGLRRRD